MLKVSTVIGTFSNAISISPVESNGDAAPTTDYFLYAHETRDKKWWKYPEGCELSIRGGEGNSASGVQVNCIKVRDVLNFNFRYHK